MSEKEKTRAESLGKVTDSLTDEQLAHYTNRFRFIEFYIQEVHT